MRILLTHVYAWPEVRRGGERYLHELASALADAGHEVTVVSSAPRAGGGEELGVAVRYVRRRRFWSSRFGDQSDEVAFGLTALGAYGWRGLDVWHALGTADAASASAVGRCRRVRSVYTNLGLPWAWYWATRPDRRLHEAVVAHVDRYVCLSQAAGSALQASYGRTGDVVGGGVDTRRFQPAPARNRAPALLFSGSLTERRKHLDLLLEAVAVLRGRLPDVELWLSGPGDPSALLAAAPAAAREAVVDLGVGRADEQADRYGRAWVTVLPSDNEAFGLTLVESLACGTPIVARTRGGGPAEIVTPGVGFRSGETPAELADACEQAIELARAPASVDACRAEAARHDWRASVVPRLEALYG